MDDLDAMLDDAAEETLPSVIDVDAMLKSTKKIEAVKPWLAFSSNVSPAIRDEWSKMVKTDALAKPGVSQIALEEDLCGRIARLSADENVY